MTELMESVIQAVSKSTLNFSKDKIKSIDIKDFDSTNYVTNIDRQIEQNLKKNLIPLVRESKFLGEEQKKKEVSDGFLWIVDPIDGTTNFVRGIPNAYTSVGLYHMHTPMLGVVYNPATDEMWTAEVGHGAQYNGKEIHVSNRCFKESILNMHYDVYHKEHSDQLFRLSSEVYNQIEDIRSFGSATYSLVSIAMGQTDLMLCQNCKIWDIAAGLRILLEAGGHYELITEDCGMYKGNITIIAGNYLSSVKFLREIYERVI